MKSSQVIKAFFAGVRAMATTTANDPAQVAADIDTGMVLVDFSAPWCAPCRLQEPILERLAGNFKGRAAVLIVNADESRDMAMRFDITSIPTLILLKNGRELRRFIGLQSMETLSRAVEEALGMKKRRRE